MWQAFKDDGFTVASGKANVSVLAAEDTLQDLLWYAVSSNVCFCKFPSTNPTASSEPSIAIKAYYA